MTGTGASDGVAATAAKPKARRSRAEPAKRRPAAAAPSRKRKAVAPLPAHGKPRVNVATGAGGVPIWALIAVAIGAWLLGGGKLPNILPNVLPNPAPNVDPAPVVALEGAWVCVVSESGDRAEQPWLGSLQRDRAFWDLETGVLKTKYKATGKFYDIDEPEIAGYKAAIQAGPGGLPALVVITPGASGGQIALQVACPQTSEEIEAKLQGK